MFNKYQTDLMKNSVVLLHQTNIIFSGIIDSPPTNKCPTINNEFDVTFQTVPQ